jgi:predicted kinase
MSEHHGMLVVVGGLPGTGKSTLAAAIGETIGAPVFVKDVIEASLWRSGIGADQGSWQVAEDLLTTLAGAQLERRSRAVVDTVARVEESRVTWRRLADATGSSFALIECVCSDDAVHRSRLDGRVRGIPGWYEVAWSDVEVAKQRWIPWADDRLVLDAVDPPELNLQRALEYLAVAPEG